MPIAPTPQAAADPRPRAVLVICTACLITTTQDSVIKWISGAYPFHEMQTIRCGAALVCVAIYALREGGVGSLAGAHLPMALLRGLLLAMASALFYLTAAAMPYPEAVALYFTMPLWVAVLARPLLGEPVSPARLMTAGAGFVGVALILRPGSALFEPAALLGLGAALCYALGNLLTRPLSRSIGAAPLAFWQNVMYLAVALALSGLFGTGAHHVTGHLSLDYLTRGWLWPTPGDFWLIVALGVSTGLLMVLFTLAYRLAASSFVAPFEYSAMFWAVLLSYAIWGQGPDPMAYAGIALIVGSGLLLAARER